MSSPQENKARGTVVAASPATALPMVTYGDSLALHINGSDIEVQHYPGGHTDGDSVIFYSQENVVHMGDLFFNGAFPYVDLGSGGNLHDYLANVDAILARVDKETIIVPGHGPVANQADLQRFQQMLVNTTAAVKIALAQGMTLEAITQRGLGEEWATWGNGFIDESAWIRSIAASL
jgi:cyclase